MLFFPNFLFQPLHQHFEPTATAHRASLPGARHPVSSQWRRRQVYSQSGRKLDVGFLELKLEQHSSCRRRQSMETGCRAPATEARCAVAVGSKR